jgi:hypothetical protein
LERVIVAVDADDAVVNAGVFVMMKACVDHCHGGVAWGVASRGAPSLILERMVRVRILVVRRWTSRPEYWQLGSLSILFFVSGTAAAKLGVLVTFDHDSFLIYITFWPEIIFGCVFSCTFAFLRVDRSPT